MTKLQKICNAFKERLKTWFDVAHSLLAISEIGADQVSEDLQSDPDADYSFSFPTYIDGEPNIINLSTLEYVKMDETYHRHKGAITELVYERIIQEYYHFLNQIIEQIVKEHITGIKLYPNIPKLQISVNFSNQDILAEIPTLIRESFDFVKNVDKISKIEKCLGKKLDDDWKKEIKKAIIVRNLLEHNQGIIRDRDIKDFGNSSIQLLDNSGIKKDFQEGDKVEITIYELFKLKQVFQHTSKGLI